jgi:hypothetical protein
MKIILRKLDYNGKIIYGYNVACFGCDYESFVLCSLLVSDKDSISAYVDTITQRNKYASDFIFSEDDGQFKNILREDVDKYIGQKAVFLYVNRQIYKDIHNPVLEQIGEDYVLKCDNQPIKEIQNTYEKIETKCDCKTYNIFNIPEENFSETWIINGKFSGRVPAASSVFKESISSQDNIFL